MININLLREPAQKRKIFSGGDLQKTHLYAVVIFLVGFLGLGGWYLQLVRADQDYRFSLEELQQESLRLKAVQAELAQYQAQKNLLDDRIGIIEQLKIKQTGPVRLMNTVIASVPEGSQLWLSNLTQKDDFVTIEGRAMDVPAIAEFIDRLQRSVYFSQVELEYWEEEEGTLKFKLNSEIEN